MTLSTHPEILPGQRYNHWTVIREDPERRNGLRCYVCQCDCGSVHVVRSQALRNGGSKQCKSCASATHRKTKTPEFGAWSDLCCRARGTSGVTKYYRDRGIEVCERWLGEDGFMNFLQDMGPKPSPKHSIDRKDNSRGYSPDNCRWATPKEQCRNRRSNRVVTIYGITATLVEHIERAGINKKTVSSRLHRGWTVEEALQP
jgi:hypothetical protein